MPGERKPEDIAEDMFNAADADENVDDLLRGTEVYEEEDPDIEDSHTEELNFDPRDSGSAGYDSFEDVAVAQDALEHWDD